MVMCRMMLHMFQNYLTVRIECTCDMCACTCMSHIVFVLNKMSTSPKIFSMLKNYTLEMFQRHGLQVRSREGLPFEQPAFRLRRAAAVTTATFQIYAV